MDDVQYIQDAGKFGWNRVVPLPSLDSQSPAPTLSGDNDRQVKRGNINIPVVATGEQDRASASTKLSKEIAHTPSVVQRNL